MAKEAQRKIIEDYIAAYNRFDVAGMMKDFHPGIVFQNISNGNVTLETKGKEAFERQATEAATYFNERRQTITSFHETAFGIEVSISYYGKLAINLPNGLNAGDAMELDGKSVFHFRDAQIIRLTDIS